MTNSPTETTFEISVEILADNERFFHVKGKTVTATLTPQSLDIAEAALLNALGRISQLRGRSC